MLPTRGIVALDNRNYGYEVRWDGFRVLVGLEGRRLSMRSSTGDDSAALFPELVGVRSAAQPDWVLLDGEVVVLEEGRPSPGLLRGRLQQAGKIAGAPPAVLKLYDVLRIGDSWLLDVAWEDRREILTRAVAPTGIVEISPAARDGSLVMAYGRELSLDSVLAKRLRGHYFPGQQTRDWLTIRSPQVAEAIICGWVEGRGARAGGIGTLLLGTLSGGRLIYAGHAGTGMNAATLQRLQVELPQRRRPECPFDTAPRLATSPCWVHPEIRCRIRHDGLTDAGRFQSPTFVELLEVPQPLTHRLTVEP